MNKYTLIANTGIQMTTFNIEIDLQSKKNNLWFRERNEEGNLYLELLHLIDFEDQNMSFFFNWDELHSNGFLSEGYTPTMADINEFGIKQVCSLEEGEDNDSFYEIKADSRESVLSRYENQWLPIPYFAKTGKVQFVNGAYNWARLKLIPLPNPNSKSKKYTVVLAFDTRVGEVGDMSTEYPTYRDAVDPKLDFELCWQKQLITDYCQPTNKLTNYVSRYLFQLAHPDCISIQQLHEERKLGYVATYVFLINALAQSQLFPQVSLFRNAGQSHNVDLVVDIGNSRTMAVVIEDNQFDKVEPLQIIDYTRPIDYEDGNPKIRFYDDPIDMRVAFRRAEFGNLHIHDSRQFVYPSLVRLGHEADYLIHRSGDSWGEENVLSTYSSPKRYLWDDKPSFEEWRFLLLEGEQGDSVLHLNGISEQLTSNGRVAKGDDIGGVTYHYSRRSLMTFAFLEMLMQARTQLNNENYRSRHKDANSPRCVRRIIVTCPTAMSKTEREALIACANDAVLLLSRFWNDNISVEVIPQMRSRRDDQTYWYYDEATCSQLVYVYGEMYKYQSHIDAFFSEYGKQNRNGEPSITIGSIDIGAGTSDLMVGEYTYKKEAGRVTVCPNPQFYDSFYYAGDDMLESLIKNVMYLDENSAIRQKLSHLSRNQYLQSIKNAFGPDHSGQTIQEQRFRRDFNLQYAMPLMYHFLHLLEIRNDDIDVTYSDVFSDNAPNKQVMNMFKEHFGFSLDELTWHFCYKQINQEVFNAFEPRLKKVATIMYASACDIILLSGRPASLPAVREIFLKYYPVNPNRLILLNNYYVGDWYPFGENTGCIVNAKTIVAMGAIVGLYGTKLNMLSNCAFDISLLEQNLKSTIRYILPPNCEDNSFLLTPEQRSAEVTVSNLPYLLNVRQLPQSTYPERPLFVVDFNKHRMFEQLKREAILSGSLVSDAILKAQVEDKIHQFQTQGPFKIKFSSDPYDMENVTVESITDRFDKDMRERNVEIHIQSMGINEKYWLDTGAFIF